LSAKALGSQLPARKQGLLLRAVSRTIKHYDTKGLFQPEDLRVLVAAL